MKKVIGILGIFVSTTLLSQAALIVDFNGSAADHDARTADSRTAGASATWNFSDTSAMFSSEDGQNTTIYGGLSMHWENGPVNPGVRLEDPGASIFTYIGSSTNPFMEGLYVWKQDDFLAGSSTQVTFDAASSLSMNITAFTLPNNSAVRFVVKQDGVYYASGVTHTGTGTFTLTDPNSNSWWRELNTADYSLGDAAPQSFTSVEAVGFYFVGQRTTTTGVIQLVVDDFQVNGSVVPEPATIGMLGFGTFIVLVARRRAGVSA